MIILAAEREKARAEGELEDEAYLQSVQMYAASVAPGEPASYQQAISGDNTDNWNAAMNEEIDSLESMGTWKETPLPEGHNTISCKWVYRIKRDGEGNIARYKARLVARGFSQVPGLDYEETYAPVTRLETIWLLLGIAASKNWEVRQLDVKSAYLHGDLDEEIYMDPPPGYNVVEGNALRLVKAIYGLKQAGRQWYKKLKEEISKFGLVQVVNDPHTFVVHKKVKGTTKTLILPVYVDDMLPIGDKVLTDNFEAWLPKYFEVSASGDASFFLGLRIQRERDEEQPSIRVDQFAFAQTILDRFRVPTTPFVPTPLSSSEKLVPNTEPIENVDVAFRR